VRLVHTALRLTHPPTHPADSVHLPRTAKQTPRHRTWPLSSSSMTPLFLVFERRRLLYAGGADILGWQQISGLSFFGETQSELTLNRSRVE
jgi:hypothetical protein